MLGVYKQHVGLSHCYNCQETGHKALSVIKYYYYCYCFQFDSSSNDSSSSFSLALQVISEGESGKLSKVYSCVNSRSFPLHNRSTSPPSITLCKLPRNEALQLSL